jgi:hydroxyacylglutathione hydrolase
MEIKQFVFNDFQENTYILFDESKECVIIDPGCLYDNEKEELDQFIGSLDLKPVILLNTHAHLDHIYGNRHVFEKYGLSPGIHKEELYNLKNADKQAAFYGLPAPGSPIPESFISEGEQICFGNSILDILFTPGHSAGHLSFHAPKEKFLICGDVLFAGSIGRTDLPGGNYNTLISSIKTKLLTLKSDTKVYSGHGISSSIGLEKSTNPFLLG